MNRSAEKEPLLVSACLLGFNCKYNGGNNLLPAPILAALRERWRVIPVCPEVAGGLPIPRVPSERRGERVVTRDGRDVTEAFRRGAETAAALAERFRVRHALLKSNSPSCGSGSVYDGSFTGRLIAGNGIAAECLKNKNLTVFNESSTI